MIVQFVVHPWIFALFAILNSIVTFPDNKRLMHCTKNRQIADDGL